MLLSNFNVTLRTYFYLTKIYLKKLRKSSDFTNISIVDITKLQAGSYKGFCSLIKLKNNGLQLYSEKTPSQVDFSSYFQFCLLVSIKFRIR